MLTGGSFSHSHPPSKKRKDEETKIRVELKLNFLSRTVGLAAPWVLKRTSAPASLKPC